MLFTSNHSWCRWWANLSSNQIVWDQHELDHMEDRVDAQHRGWELQVIGMQSNWMNNWEGTEEMMR